MMYSGLYNVCIQHTNRCDISRGSLVVLFLDTLAGIWNPNKWGTKMCWGIYDIALKRWFQSDTLYIDIYLSKLIVQLQTVDHYLMLGHNDPSLDSR